MRAFPESPAEFPEKPNQSTAPLGLNTHQMLIENNESRLTHHLCSV